MNPVNKSLDLLAQVSAEGKGVAARKGLKAERSGRFAEGESDQRERRDLQMQKASIKIGKKELRIQNKKNIKSLGLLHLVHWVVLLLLILLM
jgi:hypothetical protein